MHLWFTFMHFNRTSFCFSWEEMARGAKRSEPFQLKSDITLLLVYLATANLFIE